MKKIIDKKIMYLNCILLGLGVIFGIFFLITSTPLDKLIIKSEITDYINLIISDKVINFSSFFNSFKTNFTYIFIITITSIIYILSPIVLFVNFYKGMLIGFLMGSLILTYKIKGILLAVVSIFPHHIIMSAILIIYSSIMLSYSLKLFKATREEKSINIKLLIKRVGILFVSALILSIITSLLEIFFNSFLMSLLV